MQDNGSGTFQIIQELAERAETDFLLRLKKFCWTRHQIRRIKKYWLPFFSRR